MRAPMDGPSIERRIAAAMALAGLDYDDLAARINSSGYGARTLRRIADPNDMGRPWRGPDLAVIGQACNVSAAFWTIDFAQLGIPEHIGLAEEVEKLRHEMDVVLRIVRIRLGTLASDAASGQGVPELERPEDPEGEQGTDRPD